MRTFVATMLALSACAATPALAVDSAPDSKGKLVLMHSAAPVGGTEPTAVAAPSGLPAKPPAAS